MSKKYTVLGLYEDTGQSYAGHYTGKDQYDAMAKAAKDLAYSDTLVIIGAISGFKQLLTPGDDNQASVYASNYESED